MHFAKAILAVEALSLLLTIRDLPMNEESKRAVHSNPLIETYNFSQ